MQLSGAAVTALSPVCVVPRCRILCSPEWRAAISAAKKVSRVGGQGLALRCQAAFSATAGLPGPCHAPAAGDPPFRLATRPLPPSRRPPSSGAAVCPRSGGTHCRGRRRAGAGAWMCGTACRCRTRAARSGRLLRFPAGGAHASNKACRRPRATLHGVWSHLVWRAPGAPGALTLTLVPPRPAAPRCGRTCRPASSGAGSGSGVHAPQPRAV